MKNTMNIPITPYADIVNQEDKLKEYVIYRACFEVDKEYEQLIISFHAKNIKWFTCNVYHQNIVRGQVVQIMKKTMETIFIGIEEIFNSATSIPGSILPGTWELEFEILTDATEDIQLEVTYELRAQGVEASDNVENQRDIYFEVEPNSTSNKWYKGDFHTHTVYSDGRMTREHNLVTAKNQNLDFFVATDHNIITHLWPNDSEVVPFPGTELTTPKGHGNFLFAEKPIFNYCSLEDMYSEVGVNKIIETNQQNGIFSINHPFLAPWAWVLRETKLNMVTSLEICNDPTYQDNTLATEKALTFWSILLNDGFHITGIGGSDSHLLPDETYPDSNVPSLIGDPCTYIYAESLTAEALKSGIQAGHAVLSRDGFIDYKVRGEENFLPGGTLNNKAGVLEVTCERDAVSKIQWIVDGKIVQIDEGKNASFSYQFEDKEYHWIRVDVRDENDQYIGSTNPFYWGKKQTTLETWGDALDEWNRQKSDTI